jgi:hypothetical protein
MLVVFIPVRPMVVCTDRRPQQTSSYVLSLHKTFANYFLLHNLPGVFVHWLSAPPAYIIPRVPIVEGDFTSVDAMEPLHDGRHVVQNDVTRISLACDVILNNVAASSLFFKSEITLYYRHPRRSACLGLL